MNDAPTNPKGAGASIFFVLGALVVAVAVLAFFALGGNLNSSSNNVAALPPAPAPVAAPAPAVTPPRRHLIGIAMIGTVTAIVMIATTTIATTITIATTATGTDTAGTERTGRCRDCRTAAGLTPGGRCLCGAQSPPSGPRQSSSHSASSSGAAVFRKARMMAGRGSASGKTNPTLCVTSGSTSGRAS